MNSVFQQIDDLKAQWVAAQPLPKAKHEELWRKFRLEWNYHSNHIEGNTLTYGETELLLIMGQTTGEHTIREYDEMKAHDIAVAKIHEFAKAREIIRETHIRDLNKIILKEPYRADAVTESGQPTSVEIIPGEYKRLPNNVKSPTGESILFVSPTDTPTQMAELVEWMQSELDAPTLHPIAFAAQLHHRFLKIHPFADGNGRVARLIANYILMREGFPPLIVKTKEKANYIAALRLADVGDSAKLTDYFAREMKWSLEMALRAARGENIEEPGDVEKEVAVFLKQHSGGKAEGDSCSVAAVERTLDCGLGTFLRRLQEKYLKLAPLFESYSITGSGYTGGSHDQLVGWDDILKKEIRAAPNGFNAVIDLTLIGYNRSAPAPFDLKIRQLWRFERGRYRITIIGRGLDFSKRYAEPITHEEIESLTDAALKNAFDEIKREAGQS